MTTKEKVASMMHKAAAARRLSDKVMAKRAEYRSMPSDAYLEGFSKAAEYYGADPVELMKAAGMWDNIKGGVKSIAGVIGSGVRGQINGMKAVGQGMWNGAKQIGQGNFGQGFKTMGQGVVNGASAYGQSMWNGAKAVGNGIANGAKAVGNGIANGAQNAWSGAGGFAPAMQRRLGLGAGRAAIPQRPPVFNPMAGVGRSAAALRASAKMPRQ